MDNMPVLKELFKRLYERKEVFFVQLYHKNLSGKSAGVLGEIGYKKEEIKEGLRIVLDSGTVEEYTSMMGETYRVKDPEKLIDYLYKKILVDSGVAEGCIFLGMSREQLINCLHENFCSYMPIKRSEITYRTCQLLGEMNESKNVIFSDKRIAREMIAEVLKDGLIPVNRRSADENLKIRVYRFFRDMNELRKAIGQEPVQQGKLRFKSIKNGRRAIKKFIIENPDKRSKRKIQKGLGIQLYNYFSSVGAALEYAGVNEQEES